MSEDWFSLGGIEGRDTLVSVLYIVLLVSIGLFLSSFIGLVYARGLYLVGLLLVGTIVGVVGLMFSASGVLLFSD